jgi:hypothetical protein
MIYYILTNFQSKLLSYFSFFTAIPNAPILSTDETRLYVSSPTPNLYGLRSVNGEILWTANLTDTISSEVKVAPDDVYVYAIQVSFVVEMLSGCRSKLFTSLIPVVWQLLLLIYISIAIG